MAASCLVSLPLALHLEREIDFHLPKDQRYGGRTTFTKTSIAQFDMMESTGLRSRATLGFGKVLRALYEHEDWTRLVEFFSKRYSKLQPRSNVAERRLMPTHDFEILAGDRSFLIHAADKPQTIRINTNPSSVGLPENFIDILRQSTAEADTLGYHEDPLPCTIGPAISVGVGFASYMDLVYGNHVNPMIGLRNSLAKLKRTKADGRGRSPAEWCMLWQMIGDWIWEMDLSLIRHFSFDRPVHKLQREVDRTDAVHAAECFEFVFGRLMADGKLFGGIEWDYLRLKADPTLFTKFEARFHRRMGRDLHFETSTVIGDGSVQTHHSRTERLPSHVRLEHERIPDRLKRPCPKQLDGAAWEQWLLSITGACVVTVKREEQVIAR